MESVFKCGRCNRFNAMVDGEDEVILSPTELLILKNCERMLESILDDLEELKANLSSQQTASAGGRMYSGSDIIECPICLQRSRVSQLKNGSCPVCRTPIT